MHIVKYSKYRGIYRVAETKFGSGVKIMRKMGPEVKIIRICKFAPAACHCRFSWVLLNELQICYQL